MIIVRLIGGLGNQMFQYALGRHLAEKLNTTMKLDVHELLDRSPRYKGFVYRDYDLSIFNIKFNEFATKKEVKRFTLPKTGNKYVFQFRKFFNQDKDVVKETCFHFDRNVLDTTGDCYLYGGWQSWKYFADIEDIIRQEFSFDFVLDEKSEKLRTEILKSNAVCLNVRRGDFVNHPVHGGLELDYYRDAVKLIKDKIENPYIYVFSDDIEWCKKNLLLQEQTVYVDHSYAGDKFKFYLLLMSCCKHFIIPGSSFGWWAAWLCNSPDKIVIAPRNWFNTDYYDTSDLIPESWVRI
jgi:hypothetical protein